MNCPAKGYCLVLYQRSPNLSPVYSTERGLAEYRFALLSDISLKVGGDVAGPSGVTTVAQQPQPTATQPHKCHAMLNCPKINSNFHPSQEEYYSSWLGQLHTP